MSNYLSTMKDERLKIKGDLGAVLRVAMSTAKPRAKGKKSAKKRVGKAKK